jgi:hypothetical protein
MAVASMMDRLEAEAVKSRAGMGGGVEGYKDEETETRE